MAEKDVRYMTKKQRVSLLFYLMVRCDMGNGRICDMSKEDIDDTWYDTDLTEIIQMSQSTCAEFNGKEKN